MSVHHDQSPARAIEANVKDGTTVRTNPLPFNVRAGKPKGYAIQLVPGHRSRTSPLPGMQHMDIRDNPDASSANVTDPSLPGKHEPPVMVHPSMSKAQVAGATFNGEDILKEAMGGIGRHGLPVKGN
jgi:hypothetical protein